MIPPSTYPGAQNRGQNGVPRTPSTGSASAGKTTGALSQAAALSNGASFVGADSWTQILEAFLTMEVESLTNSTAFSSGSGLGTNLTDANVGSGLAGTSSAPDSWLTALLSDITSRQTATNLTGQPEAIALAGQPGAAPSGDLQHPVNMSSSPEVTAAIEQASQQYGLPSALIHSVIQNESSYDPNAVSSVGAMGLMQLMPSTAREMGVQNPFDPVQNILGGTRYLASLVSQFHGDLKLAVAAYNAGPGAVTSHGGVPPYPETQAYVGKVLQGAGLLT